ncbi:histidinol dehydrogenase [Phaeobacter sp. 11ANDIMAR09]|uniref:histidinol dehydrogenase n=1 Tax=Phaeobacter sp. 11ANDIMAR09 TaxID=1225647 RepID=UPI0006C863CE|nr:histidinol dehydrogenase [Phaeobacter sp. 11ANDIMAR09]KPD12504.1 histidinol dehydrogenase [Phaeobacter sp. 11ANDIMAR09]
MTVTYLKKAAPRPEMENTGIREVVSSMLTNIERDGEEAVRRYAKELDRWEGDIVLSDADRAAACARVPEDVKADICFAYANIRRFAQAQQATVQECEIEVIPGLIAGQKQIPVSCAGCYVPGGRYSHIASALMTITTAKVAGVPHITAVSPPRERGIPDAIVYAMDLCGADLILNLGGVQGIAAMAQGLFGGKPADILVGPGNSYVAEAKRMLFGDVGIDMFAGPTDSLVIADHTASVETVSWDLVSQAEHGTDSPVWLIATDRALAEGVLERVHTLIADLPEPNGAAARTSWEDRAEVILCDSREEAVAVSDRYAPEHLHVQADQLDWWLDRLGAYGSLFLGEKTTVSFGDKTSGPNHVLPTSGAARYTGGLSVHKFTKTVTWQRCNSEASQELAQRTARISRMEGMEGHARAAEMRLTGA